MSAVLLTHVLFFGLPFHAERGISQHVVELPPRMTVLRHEAIGFILGVLDT
ncbi:hypothetical protein D3C77_442890 [compost metagenome]